MTPLKANPLLDAATVLVGWTNRSATRDTEKVFTSGEVVKLNTKLNAKLNATAQFSLLVSHSGTSTVGDASESDGIEEPDLDPDPTAEVPVLTALPAMPYSLPQQPSTVGGQRVRLLPADDLELFWLHADSRWNEPIGSAAIELLINPARASLPPFRCLGRWQRQRRAPAGCLQASATPAARLRPAGRCDRAGAAGDGDRHAACCPDGLPSGAQANDRRILLRAPQALTISRVDAVLTFGGDQLC